MRAPETVELFNKKNGNEKSRETVPLMTTHNVNVHWDKFVKVDFYTT